MKGKFGIVLSAYVVISLLLCVLGSGLMTMVLLLGFVMVAENHQSTTKQVMEVTLFSFALNVIHSALNAVNGGINSLLRMTVVLSGFTGTVNMLFDVLGFAVSILCLVFVILSLINVGKGKEVKIPGVHALANKMFGE